MPLSINKHIVFLLLIAIFQPLHAAEQATVAVASNFKPTLVLLQQAFQQLNSEHSIRISSASTAVLFNQISHGAPFDIYLAADQTHPQKLADAGLGIKNSRFTYALGQLVLATRYVDLSNSSEQLIRGHLEKIEQLAIANPKLAPYGLAAQQSLEHLQLWPSLQGRFVVGNNISQTQQFFFSENVDWAFIPLSPLLEQHQIPYWLIPKHWYQPIRQQAILLQSGQNNAAALAFMTFLSSPTAHEIIQHQGYLLPDER